MNGDPDEPRGIAIGAEAPGDAPAVRLLLLAGFPTRAEADLVDRLRSSGDWRIGLVAREGGAVVGQVGFSPVRVEGGPDPGDGLGLAPLAVAEAARGRGLGGRLVRAGLDACREAGAGYVVVLGDLGYYGRFGFEPASRRGLGNAYGVTEPFMILALRPGGIPGGGGVVRCAPAFDGL